MSSVLKKYQQQYNDIMEYPIFVRNSILSELMTKMEKEFDIPYLNDEKWNKDHEKIIELYRKISNSRSL